ncbi:Protein M3, partial [Tulasnella sp. 403]
MLSPGSLVWISIKPLLKMAITTTFGIVLTKKDLFGGVATRGAVQIVVNVTLPALLFSKIVPSFTTDNIKALGPLVLIGTLYQILGLLLAFLVRQFFWVPHRFRYGILAAGTWGNWGDIPTAVIMSITSGAPFNGQKDSDLAVAYLSVFILVFYVSLFPMGGHLMIAKDFEGPDFTDDEVRESFSTKVKKTGVALANASSAVGKALRLLRPHVQRHGDADDLEKQPPSEKVQPMTFANNSELKLQSTPAPTIFCEPLDKHAPDEGASDASGPVKSTRMVAFHSSHRKSQDEATETDILGQLPTLSPTAQLSGLSNSQDGEMSPKDVTVDATSTIAPSMKEPPRSTPPPRPTKLRRLLAILRNLNTPPTIAIFIAFPVALVPRLKNLFITMPDSPRGPDGLAPLAFVMDTANFIGAASVPLGLVCLGSALARLTVPKPWTRLPLGAIGVFTFVKLFFMPVLGVLLCKLFTERLGILDKDDKVLRFVCIFFSSVPTATTQVLLTQIYSPDGNAEHLSAFLVPQYALMFL